MRTITAKYDGECRACSEATAAGDEVVYERGIGVFHPACAPTDPDEIRAYRDERAERKAGRYEEWAEKRRAKAAALEKQNEPYRGDIAFNTQPGHIPERARAIRRSEKAWEHSTTASEFEGKARRLRNGVRVAGDAERKREQERKANDQIITVGDLVDTVICGPGIVLKINAKTYTCSVRDGAYKSTFDKSWCRLIEKREPVKEEYEFKPGDKVVCRRLCARYHGTVKRRTSRGYSVEYQSASGRTLRETFSPGDVFADTDQLQEAQRADGLA